MCLQQTLILKGFGLWKVLKVTGSQIKYLSLRNSSAPRIKVRPESIEWFMEDQDFLQSYDLVPPPPRSASCLSFSVCVLSVELPDMRGGGGGSGGGAKHTKKSLVPYKSLKTLFERRNGSQGITRMKLGLWYHRTKIPLSSQPWDPRGCTRLIHRTFQNLMQQQYM
jgi:hypothetical protein